MTTNVQGTRPTTHLGDPPVGDPTPTTTVIPTGGGVAIFDLDDEQRTDPSLRTTALRDAATIPAETRSTGSILSWIIGAVVLIVLAYFLLQFLF